MPSVNRACILGHLGRDPELKYLQSGAAVCNLSVATSERFKDKSGEQQERTEWHRVTCWNKLAENCAQYLAKGSLVYIEGSIQTRQWEKDGEKRYTTEIRAFTVQFLDKKSDEGSGREESLPPGDSDESVPF